MRQNTRKEGNEGEDMACRFLEGEGCRIIARNFRSRRGEIDIISEDCGAIVFTEVKYRKSCRTGEPYEAVTFYKQRNICRTADFFRMKNGLSWEQACRFDVVSILGSEITWYKNAYEYIEKR